jgi:hypothetical protein
MIGAERHVAMRGPQGRLHAAMEPPHDRGGKGQPDVGGAVGAVAAAMEPPHDRGGKGSCLEEPVTRSNAT